jgi:ribosomal protein S18 acetylase RimI-like enzyme
MTLQLRQAVISDLPAIYRGEEAYIRQWEPQHEAAWRSQTERHLTQWVENFERMTVAVLNNQFAGYSLWAHTDDCAELYTLHVAKTLRRNGIGTALFEGFVIAASGQGFTGLRLSVRPDNPAKGIYERAGFQCTGTAANGYLTYERHS